MPNQWLRCVCGMVLVAVLCAMSAGAGEPSKAIKVWAENPRFWECGGEPVLLLGGSVEDNLFQIPDLEAHLDLLHSVGGNYVRNTMSSRDEGNVWPFKKVDGLYDLDQWNREYWERFARFLKLTKDRGIIVQIEVWATFDHYRDIWARNPLNPKNNSTYTVEESGLPTEVNSHPLACQNNFFWSVPGERNQKIVLKYQRRFVDKMLSYSLKYGHVLYCMDNETAVTAKWGAYWSAWIKKRAAEAGVTVNTTEMWDPWDLMHAKHRATFDHPETYSFVDVSQNNHNKGDKHWTNIGKVRERLAGQVRPMNCVKMYGADGGPFGSTRDAMERFWRNVFGGIAATRFHRPSAGLGLDEHVQTNIKSMRMLTDEMNVFACGPRNELLGDRKPNDAFCMANPGVEYAVYFPNGGQANLDITPLKGMATVRWLDIMRSAWHDPQKVEAGKPIALASPSPGYWAVLVNKGG
jgi:hypothetical protein